MDNIETEPDDIWVWSTAAYDGFQRIKDKHTGQIERTPTGELYHYTSASGLKGIINSKNIRMTDLKFMSDASELDYAVTLIKDVISKKSHEYNSRINDFLQRLHTRFVGIKEHFNIYAACFCEASNKASFWNNYGKYSVVVDADETLRVKHHFTRLGEWNKSIFRKVIYDEEKQRDIIRSITDDVLHIYINNLQKDDVKENRLRNNAISLFSNLVAECLVSFKSNIYREEEEWRMIFFQMNRNASDIEETQTLVKGDYIIPFVDMGILKTNKKEYTNKVNILSRSRRYKKLDNLIPDKLRNEVTWIYGRGSITVADHRKAATAVGKFPVKRINIGPVHHGEIARKSVKIELTKSKLDGVDVKDVEVPLRSGW